MKIAVKVLVIVLCLATLFCGFAVFAADGSANGEWRVDEDGKEKYYVNGNYVTGNYQIGAHTYVFADDGECLGPYDAYKNVGPSGVMDTEAFKTAVASRNPFVAETFNAGRKLGNTEITAEGLAFKSSNGEYAANFTSGVQTVVRAGEYGSFKRSDSNLAYTYRHQQHIDTYLADYLTAKSSSHSYMHKNGFANEISKSNGDIILEVELGLVTPPSGSASLFSLMDRSNGDPGDENISTLDTTGVLAVNKEGYVYSPRKSEYLLCKLDSKELTRISLAIHSATNTFDVYINGVKLLEGITTYKGTAQKPEEFRIEECRMFEIGSNANNPNSAHFIVDNLYFYAGTEPVCLTSGVELKNGFVSDGSYLRCYENGLIRTGKFAVNGEFFGQKMEGTYTVFESGTGAAFIGYNYIVTSGGVTVSSGYAPGNRFEAPKAVDIEGKKFVGWSFNGKLVEPGYTQLLTSNVTVDSVGVGFSLVKGAAMSTKKDTAELIFAAKIAKADYDNLVALGATVEPHIVTVSTENIQKAHGYLTPEHLAVEGLAAPVDTVAADWLDESENYYFYGATVSGIEDYLKEYSAIAYLKVTLPSGQIFDIYADYSEENNSRNLYEVASAAFNDRSTAKVKGSYDSFVAFGGVRTYSPYSLIDRSRIKAVLDTMVVLETDNKTVESSGDFYVSPYNLTYTENETGFDVTIEKAKLGWKADELKGVIVDGKLLAEEEYQINDGVMTLAVESGKIFLYEAEPVIDDNIEANSWTYATSTTDTGIFSSVVSSPAVTDDGKYVEFDGQSKLFKWSFDKTSIILSNSEAIKSMKKDGYYDLSGWQSMVFSVYVPAGYEGATFQFNFNSENPATTEGSDYYGKRISLDAAGWNKIVVNKSELGASRTPLGWSKITSVGFTTTGWSQENDIATTVYVSDIIAYDKPIKSLVTSGKADAYTKSNQSAMFTIDGYAGTVEGQTYKINPYDTDTKVFKENDIIYLPVNVFAVALDENAVFYEKSGIVTYFYDNDKYTFTPDSTKYKVGKDYKELTYPTIRRGGGLFISLEDAMAVYEYEKVFVDRMGLIVLSNNAIELDSVKDQSSIFEYIKELMFIRPTGDKMYQDLMESSGGQHPYIMVNGEDFADLRYYLKYDETLQKYVTNAKTSYGIGSANFRSQTQWFRRTDGRRLLSISRDVMNKIIGWGVLYQLDVYSGEEKQMLVDRVWAEAQAVANFYDEEYKQYSWNPSHYLDTGEAAYAMAIAYDWFYDAWTPEQRSQIARAIYEYGLQTTSVLEGGSGNYNLAGATNNWNGVCNGGIMAGSLAIVNDAYIVSSGLQDEVIAVMGASVKGVESGMWVYGPDGGYEEGPGYWSYGTTYCMVVMASLNSSCGTNYGLYYTPGFAHSAYFTTYLGNANTTWGFHDGGSGGSNPSIAAWFAGISGDGNLNAIRRQGIEKGWCGSSLYDIMFFNPHIITNSIDLSLDAYYSLDTIMTFRSSWDTSNNIFAGLHGGDNAAGHGDLDIGNFVINVNGVFLINDLGADAYNMQGYFGGYRWSYYRKRTEGQNCLVMLGHGESWDDKTGRPEYYIDSYGQVVEDPAKAEYAVSAGVKYYINDDYTFKMEKDSKGNVITAGKVSEGTPNVPNPNYYGQKASAISRAVAFESGVNSAYGVVDMAPAYVASKGQMLRGLYMMNNRSIVVIQDEGNFSSYQDIWWFAHSQGEITVSEDKKSAIIYRSGIYLYAEIVTDPNKPVDAEFSVMDWESLDSNYVGDTVKSGIYTDEIEYGRTGQKLVLTAENTKDFNCAVAFKVISSPAAAPTELGTIYTWTPIKDWKAE